MKTDSQKAIKSKETTEKQTKLKKWPGSAKVIILTLVILVSLTLNGIFIYRLLAAGATVTDPFDDESKIASKAGLAVSGGLVKLAEWTFGEDGCNNMPGWHWYTTNGRSACWSKTLVDSVSWNKGVGADTRVTGTYTCAPLGTYNLQTRMQAAANGEWYKICSIINGHTMAVDGSEDGQAGATYISALAISDCLDGTKDLLDCDKGTTCVDWSSTNGWLRTWAGAAGKSALPYLATGAGTLQTDNDYWDACVQSGDEDQTLGCTSGNNYFYLNREVCNNSDTNYSWAAAAGNTVSDYWSTNARYLGRPSCSYQNYQFGTSYVNVYLSFRAVLRP